MPRYDFTEAQLKALTIVPKVTAMASFLGSMTIVIEILIKRKTRLERIYHRLMLAMSLLDVLSSLAYFMSTWPMPADTENVYGAVGNTASCSAQGFFIQLGLVSACFFGLPSPRLD